MVNLTRGDRPKDARPPPAEGNLLECGGRHGLTNSTVKNYTSAKLVLNGRVRSSIIE
jgi:hypothetical protein